jgi:hypothetical protein
VSDAYPAEVRRFHDVLVRIPGVVEAETRLTSLRGIAPGDLADVDLAELPHAAVRLAGLPPDMAVLQVEFDLTRDERGWRALEFIAWAVKDLARSGEQVQLRPTGLPPLVHETVQLGRTLRFQLDAFVTAPEDIAPALAKLDALAGYFEKYLALYGQVLADA